MRRRVLLTALVCIPVVALGAAAAIAWWPGSLPDPLSAPENPLLPDLAMSPLTSFLAGRATDGDVSVRFTASIGNVGEGPFIVHAVRADDNGDWRVSQRFRETAGPTSERVTEGDLTYGGHGHDHWHVQLGASYWLTRPGSSVILRRYEKVGYCFFDQAPLVVRPADAPAVPTFGKDACDGERSLAIEMGLSPGFADPYPWTLPDQRLVVNGLADGLYRLWAAADPQNQFLESDERNNVTWVDLRLTASTSPPRVEVVRQGRAGASAWVR